MSYSTGFALAFLPVAPLWALMVFLPRWSWTGRIVTQPWSYAPLAVAYTLMVLVNAAEVVPVIVANPSLETVAPLLATPAGATIAWLHFLVFDVFVGRWAYLDSRTLGVHPVVMAPVLLLMLLFGPAGFLAYLVVRSAAARRSHDHKATPGG
jgi:hypothetical protein